MNKPENGAQIIEDQIGEPQTSSQHTLESGRNSLFGLEMEVDNSRGFVKSEETIEEFVERVKGPDPIRIHRARFYRDDGVSLGFSVSKVSFENEQFKMIVNDVTDDGKAYKEGLRAGDRILVVNKVMLRSSEEHEEALEILKSTGSIEIILAQNTHQMTKVQTQSQLHRIVLNNDVNGLGFGITSEEGRNLVERIIPNTPAAMASNLKIGDELVEICGKSTKDCDIEQIYREVATFGAETVELYIKRLAPLDEDIFAEGETYDVTIETKGQGMGISVNNPLDKNSTLGITIKSVVADSPADQTGKIGTGDRIIVVNAESIFGKTCEFSMNKLRNAGNDVHLTLMKLPRQKPAEQIKISNSIANSFKQDVNNRKKKWEQILGPDFEVIVEPISKNDPSGGWGFSLEGLEIEDSNGEVVNKHFLKVIAELGPVGRSGVIKQGDELLEIVELTKSREVRGLNHAEAVKMLTSMPSSVHFIVARNRAGGSPIEIIRELETQNEQDEVNETVNESQSLKEAAFVLSEDQITVEKRDSVYAPRSTSHSPVIKPETEPPRNLKWSWEVSEAYVNKSPFEQLGLTFTNFQRGSEKHIIIESIKDDSPASRVPELAVYDKLISVQGKSIVGRTLAEVTKLVNDDSELGPVMLGVRKLEDNLRRESNVSSLDLRAGRSASPDPVSTSYASDAPTPPPPLTLRHEEPEIVREAQNTQFSSVVGSSNYNSWREEAKIQGSVRERTVQWGKPASRNDSSNSEKNSKVRGNQSSASSEGREENILPSALEQKIAVSKSKVGVVGLSVGREPRGNGVLVKSTLPGGAAARDGRIEVGDIIRAINDVKIMSMEITDVRSLLRELGRKEDDVFITYITREDAQYFWTYEEIPDNLTVKTCLYFEGIDSDASLARSNSSMMVGAIKRTTSSFMTPSADTVLEAETSPINSRPLYSETNPFKDQEKPRMPSFSAPRDEQGIAVIDDVPDHDQFMFGPKRLVEVARQEGEPLGLSILGHEMGIFIKDVNPGSPAAGPNRDSQNSDDVLNPGDRIISVNGQNLSDSTQRDAVLIIKGARSPLRFIVQSCTVKGDKNETLFSSIN